MSTVTAKCLAETQYAGSSAAAIYTAPAATKAIIDSMTVTNTDSSAHTVTIDIVPSGGTLGTGTTITSALSIAANTAVSLAEMKNQILNAADSIQVVASVASKVVVRLSGREIV